MTEKELKERMKQSKSKVKDGLSTSIIDMLPEDRELAATRFVGVDVGGGDDQSPEPRWIPGYLIMHKADKNRMAIVEGDYAYLHGGRDVDSLSIGELDSEGKVKSIWAWAHRDEWELLDTEHVKENILKLIEYKDKVNSI